MVPPTRYPTKATRKVLSGANDTRCRKNGFTSRHTHTLQNTPLTNINTIPLRTKGSPSLAGEELDHQQRETIYALIDQLERESFEIRQDKTLSHGRAVILNQDTDALRAGLIEWASYGPSGRDIPRYIPLTGFQVEVLNERIRKELAYRGLPMITPILRPQPHTTNIPPLQPPRPKEAYYHHGRVQQTTTGKKELDPTVTATTQVQRPLTSGTYHNERSQLSLYLLQRGHPLFRMDITHSAELPPTYPNPYTTSMTVFVYNGDKPPRGQAWKVGFTRAFDSRSAANSDTCLRMTLKSVSYAPHYPKMLCLRVIHSPGLENQDLLHGLREVARGGLFGKDNINCTITRTFTDIIVTFGEGAHKPPPQATTAASQITKLLDLRRANHPAKYIQDYKSEGPALRIPVLTSDLKDKKLSFPFKQGDYFVQLYHCGHSQILRHTGLHGNSTETLTLARPTETKGTMRILRETRIRGVQRFQEDPQTHRRRGRTSVELPETTRKTGHPKPPPSTSPSAQSNSSTDSEDRSRILGYTLHPDRRETARTHV